MFFYYILFINLLSFSFMGIDKYKAIHHKWRISEKTLFVSALLLGSVGSIAGMYVFRHKTKHKQFVYGMPAIFLFQLLFCLLWLYTSGALK